MPHQFEFLEDSLVEELFYRADKVKVDTIYCTTKILNGTVEINLSVVSIIVKSYMIEDLIMSLQKKSGPRIEP